MDSHFSTPLYDMFRRGEVSHDVRMLAAQGVLAPRAHEQLVLLVLLTSDSDARVRSEAERTLSRIPAVALSAFLARSDVPNEVRSFFAARGIQAAGSLAQANDEPLFEAPDTDGAAEAPPPTTAAEAPGTDEAPDDPSLPPAEGTPASDGEAQRMAIVQRLSLMNVTQKVKTAMRGSREERGILIRDPNKLVGVAVLSSPKLTESEVEAFAKMASVSEDVLLVIGTTRAWLKNYAVVNALCHNPKTPVALSLGFVKRLLERDVKSIVTDRNLPEPLRFAARKMTQAGEVRRS